MADERKIEERIKDIGCTQLKSFRRNRYFYGKLLTVKDFEDEQRYFIEKQRLINRLIHGAGVVCGLKVEGIEDKGGFIRINPGVAFDYCGREIVVPEPVQIDLSKEISLEEFEEESTITRWVGIYYDACGKEPVPAYSVESSCEETCCYGRIEEGYRIEILEEMPEEGVADKQLCSTWSNLVTNKIEGKYIDLEKKTPKWVKVGEYFNVYLKIKANFRDLEVTIEPYRSDDFEIDKDTFPSEPIFLKAGEEKKILYKIKALNTGKRELVEGCIIAEIRGVTGKEEYDLPSITINVSNEPERERIEEFIDRYQKACPGFKEIPVILAKIKLERENNSIKISEIDNAILEDRESGKKLIYSLPVLYELIKCVEKQEGPQGPKGEKGERGPRGPKGEQGPPGPGLEEGLTYIEKISWKHGDKITLKDFENMIKNKKFFIEFSQEVISGVDQNTFVVTIRTPITHPLEGVRGWRLYHEEYIPGRIVSDENKKKFTFTMDDKNLLYLSRYIKESLGSMTQISIIIKCDFIIDKNKKAVAGHHIGGGRYSGLHIDGKYNIQGGIFESWFYIVPEG